MTEKNSANHIPEISEDSGNVETSSKETGYYVYAIGCLSHRRGDEAGAAPTLPSMGILPDTPVEMLAYRDILAFVSRVPMSQFSQDALDENLKRSNWVRDCVIAHQATLAGLLSSCAIIPCKFCTVYLSRERVTQMLIDGYEGFSATLQLLANTTEWGVKVYCNLPIFARQVEATSEVLRSQREAVAKSRPGTAYFLRKKLEQAALREAENVVTTQVQHIHTELTEHARSARLNKAQTPQEHGHKDEMFLNAAYLIADDTWHDFRAALDGLAASYGQVGFEIELTGPWPPYNFADAASGE